MKMSYEILWIDDERKFFDSKREEIEKHLGEFGIRPDITFVDASKIENTAVHVRDRIQNQKLDLIFVDFNMDAYKGSELIRVLRRSDHIYLPVIFYSAASVENLFLAVKEEQLDGVYVANQQFFTRKVKDVIDSLIKKEQTPKRIRGLLMEAVSEIDVRLCKLIQKLWQDIDWESKEVIKNYLYKDIARKNAENAKIYNQFPSDLNEFEQIFNSKMLKYTRDINTRCRLTLKLLDQHSQFEVEREVLHKFIDSTNSQVSLNNLRNQFAHQSREELNEQINNVVCKRIREDIREQLENLDTLLARIKLPKK